MPKFISLAALDGGLSYVKSNVTNMLLISTYSIGDPYATVVGNKLADVVLISDDLTISTNGLNRILTTASGKSATSTSSSSGNTDSHIAFTDGVNNVIFVTDEISNIAFTSPKIINFPPTIIIAAQPT